MNTKLLQRTAVLSLASALFWSNPLAAATPTLFIHQANNVLSSDSELKTLPSHSFQQVVINTEALNVEPNSTISLNLPNTGIVSATYEKSLAHPDGTLTWIGFVNGYGKEHRVIFSYKDGHYTGRISTPDGIFSLKEVDGALYLIDQKESGLKPVPFGDDGLVPPLPPGEQPASTPVNAQAPVMAASGNTVIDVLVLYSAGFETAHSGSALDTRINNLVSLANTAYSDSLVSQEIRVVHKAKYDYSDLNSNSDALTALTNGTGVFSSVASLRSTYGADLVIFLRDFQHPEHVSCGVAWVYNGASNFGTSYAYGVASDGSDGGFYCSDYTFAHELGHNMGSGHDRNTGCSGRYNYSCGYGISGTFGTIMSYINPETSRFSNPNITCTGGSPCGVSENDANAAYNALSLNNTKTDIAGFQPTVVTTTDKVTVPAILYPVILSD